MPISRRNFLKGGAAFAGALGAVFFGVRWAQPPVPPSQPPGPPSQPPGHQVFNYRGRSVVIDETPSTVSVTINGLLQHDIAKNVPQKGQPFYSTHMLPFENFPDAVQLVKAVIDGEDLGLYVVSQ